jgi:hypothetical protein
MKAVRKLYLTNGTKYKLEMQDRSITKGVWSADKFCWTTSLGRTRIPVDIVRRVAVLDSTVTERSSDFGWFPTVRCFLDKWHPKNRREWVNPIRGRALGAPRVIIPDDDSME